MVKTLKIQILEVVEKMPDIGQSEIAKNIPTTTKGTISAYMSKLKDSKLVDTPTFNHYRLDEKGKELLKKFREGDNQPVYDDNTSKITETIIQKNMHGQIPPQENKGDVSINYHGIDFTFNTKEEPAKVIERIIELKKQLTK